MGGGRGEDLSVNLPDTVVSSSVGGGWVVASFPSVYHRREPSIVDPA